MYGNYRGIHTISHFAEKSVRGRSWTVFCHKKPPKKLLKIDQNGAASLPGGLFFECRFLAYFLGWFWSILASKMEPKIVPTPYFWPIFCDVFPYLPFGLHFGPLLAHFWLPKAPFWGHLASIWEDLGSILVSKWDFWHQQSKTFNCLFIPFLNHNFYANRTIAYISILIKYVVNSKYHTPPTNFIFVGLKFCNRILR